VASNYQPYTYRVTHVDTGEFYIGSKYAKGTTPETTKDYFGSPTGKGARSTRYRQLLRTERHKLVKQVLSTHTTKQETVAHESSLHFLWFDDPLCLNGSIQTSAGFSHNSTNPTWLFEMMKTNHPRGMLGKKHSAATKEKFKKRRVGKKPDGWVCPFYDPKNRGVTPRDPTLYTIYNIDGRRVTGNKRELRLLHNVRVEKLVTDRPLQKGWRLHVS